MTTTTPKNQKGTFDALELSEKYGNWLFIAGVFIVVAALSFATHATPSSSSLESQIGSLSLSSLPGPTPSIELESSGNTTAVSVTWFSLSTTESDDIQTDIQAWFSSVGCSSPSFESVSRTWEASGQLRLSVTRTC